MICIVAMVNSLDRPYKEVIIIKEIFCVGIWGTFIATTFELGATQQPKLWFIQDLTFGTPVFFL